MGPSPASSPELVPPLPRADGRGGVLILRGLSADGGQPVVGQVIPDRLGKADGLTFIDG